METRDARLWPSLIIIVVVVVVVVVRPEGRLRVTDEEALITDDGRISRRGSVVEIFGAGRLWLVAVEGDVALAADKVSGVGGGGGARAGAA